MQLRPLEAKDLPAIAGLLHQLGYEIEPGELAVRASRIGAAPDHCAVVAEMDGVVVGLSHVFARPALERPHEAVVQALIVDQSCRGTGIGRALMGEAEAWARARGLFTVVLHTRVDREDARAFYAGLGYEVAATSNLMCKALQA